MNKKEKMPPPNKTKQANKLLFITERNVNINTIPWLQVVR